MGNDFSNPHLEPRKIKKYGGFGNEELKDIKLVYFKIYFLLFKEKLSIDLQHKSNIRSEEII